MQQPCERPIEIPTPAKAHFLALSGIWPTSANQEADDCFRHKRDQLAARVLGMGAGEDTPPDSVLAGQRARSARARGS